MYYSIKKALERSLAQGDIEAKPIKTEGDVFPHFHRKDLARWARQRSNVPEFLEIGLAELVHIEQSWDPFVLHENNGDSSTVSETLDTSNDQPGRPSSPELDLIHETWEHWWKGNDSQCHAPGRIATWLEQTHAVDNKRARAVEGAIRPEWANDPRVLKAAEGAWGAEVKLARQSKGG